MKGFNPSFESRDERDALSVSERISQSRPARWAKRTGGATLQVGGSLVKVSFGLLTFAPLFALYGVIKVPGVLLETVGKFVADGSKKKLFGKGGAPDAQAPQAAEPAPEAPPKK